VIFGFFRSFLGKKRSGFTLMETLIVISIVAILAGVSFLTLFNRSERKDFETTVQKIVAVLNDARDRSVAQRDGVAWRVSFSNPKCPDPSKLPPQVPLSFVLEDENNLKYNTNNLSGKVYFASSSSLFADNSCRKNISFYGLSGKLFVTPPVSLVDLNVFLINNPSISSTISVSAFGVVTFTTSSISSF
jgi:prepilin-type N-terminal cleavage/methylation domain-containing protein